MLRLCTDADVVSLPRDVVEAEDQIPADEDVDGQSALRGIGIHSNVKLVPPTLAVAGLGERSS